MENAIAGKQLQEYNTLLRENDEIYREVLQRLKLPEGAFWILYALRADGQQGKRMTQSEMGRILYLPKQTLNSALKKLEAAGVLELAAGQDRRSKYVLLTAQGVELARRTVDRLIAAENGTFAQLSSAEQEVLLGTLRKFTDLFRKNVESLKEEQV